MFLTPTHLAIVMEYAAGGDLLEFVNTYKAKHGCPLPEDYARFFFHQILCGIGYMHKKVPFPSPSNPIHATHVSMLCVRSLPTRSAPSELAPEDPPRSCWRQGMCHRDLKLENILLDADANSPEPPTVKICDFGFSKVRFQGAGKGAR